MKKLIYFAISIGCFILLSSDAIVQTPSNYWVYEIVETTDHYNIIRTHAITGVFETVYTLPVTPNFSLVSIMPSEELATADEFLADSTYATSPGFSVNTFFDRPPVARLQHVAVSPENSDILAINNVYQTCVNSPRFECFGVSQIILLDIATQLETLLWSLPMQANTSYFSYCVDTAFIPASNDTFIQDIRWLPDQQAIAAEINYKVQLPDNPVVIIPISNSNNAVVVGNGDQGWSIASDSRTATSISFNCVTDNRYELVARVTQFDLTTQLTNYIDYPLGSIVNRLPDVGVANLNNTIVFGVTLLDPQDISANQNRLAILDPNSPNPIHIVDTPIPTLQSLNESPLGNVVIVEDIDGYLWKLVVNDTDFSLIPITTLPVDYWQFASDDELVVQYVGDTQYSISIIPPTTTCDTTIVSGDVTGLIGAIDSADNTPEADTICLEAGTYTLTAVNNSSNGDNGLPQITTDITLVGLDAGATLYRDANAPAFRHFLVGGTGHLTLHNVVLVGIDISDEK